jgi:hypothetical protein
MMSTEDLPRALETEADNTMIGSNTGTACGSMWMLRPGSSFDRGDGEDRKSQAVQGTGKLLSHSVPPTF